MKQNAAAIIVPHNHVISNAKCYMGENTQVDRPRPDRGVGIRPTPDTRNGLVDAFLSIKAPGESDGQCSRGPGTGDNVVDPIWGRVLPDAGVWFPEQALELAKLANPPLE